MKTKTLLLASAAGAAFMPTAQAADLPLKAPMMAPIVAPANWAGWYIGGHLGGAGQHNSIWTDDYSGSSFIAGGQIGYNWQRGNFVYGIEADGSWLSQQAFHKWNGFDKGSNIDWLVTVRGRMGLTFGDTMAYATGGLAIGGAKTKTVYCCADEQASGSDTRLGWVIGAGVEHMVSRNWTIALEGLYVDLGNRTKTICSLNKCDEQRITNSAFIGRFKANYKF